MECDDSEDMNINLETKQVKHRPDKVNPINPKVKVILDRWYYVIIKEIQ